MINEIHMYRERHLFNGDFHIGLYDAKATTVYLRTRHEGAKDLVRQFFGQRFGYVPRVEVTDEEPALPLALLALPPSVLRQVDPTQGDRTPAVETWIRANHSPEQIAARYGEATAPETETASKRKR
jgi:hypothetical protein